MRTILALILAILLTSCTAQNTSNYSKIEYEAGPCFGFCPIFTITINPDRSAMIDAQHHTFTQGPGRGGIDPNSKEGKFTATIKEDDYKMLINKLDSLNLKSLKNYYGNKNVTDLPTSHLRITYENGDQVQIEDYGKAGTEDLRSLYEYIENLRKTQKWTKIGD